MISPLRDCKRFLIERVHLRIYAYLSFSCSPMSTWTDFKGQSCGILILSQQESSADLLQVAMTSFVDLNRTKVNSLLCPSSSCDSSIFLISLSRIAGEITDFMQGNITSSSYLSHSWQNLRPSDGNDFIKLISDIKHNILVFLGSLGLQYSGAN